MSIKTKIAALALATLAATGGLASTTTQAQAGGGGGLAWGVGAGLLGAAVVGSAIAANNGYYYNNGYRRCGGVDRPLRLVYLRFFLRIYASSSSRPSRYTVRDA